jgi:hypothetical protein
VTNAPVEYPLAAPASIEPTPPEPAPAVRPRAPRRPIFGWIAFGLVVLAYLAVAGVAFYAYGETADAFIQGPPWWALTSQLASLPVAILCLLGLVLGIVGAVRREKPGWPAVAAMIFSLPGFGYVAIATYVWFTVTASCASPPGACGL